MKSARTRALAGSAGGVLALCLAAGAQPAESAGLPGGGTVSARGDGTRPVLGQHKVLIVPVYWTNPGTATASQLSSVVSAMDNDYNTWTGGKIRFSVDQVKAWTKLDLTTSQVTSCDLGAIETATRAAIGSVTADQYHHIVALFPYNAACSFTSTGSFGVGVSGNGFAWVNDSLKTGVWSRAMGYNLGLTDSGSLTCWSDPGHTHPVPLSDYCEQTPLDDPWDTMGDQPYGTTGFMSAANLEKLGVLGGGSAATVAWDQTVTLSTLASGAGLRSVSVVNGPNTYYLEYRAPVGMDSWIDDKTYVDPSGELRTDPGGGVIVRRVRTGFGHPGEMDVVDFHPDTNPAPTGRHPGLDALGEYTTPSGDIHLKVTAASNSSATVALSFPNNGSLFRWSGKDRYVTSAVASANSFTMHASTVFIASGENFPDALSGAAAAGRLRSPLLLTGRTSLANDVKNELARLQPDRIVVLGGTSVISDDVLGVLKTLTPDTIRISGADRYATAASISQTTYAPGVDTAYVASGLAFPDALSGAPVAGKTAGPMLLVAPDAIPSVIVTELQRLRPKRIVILGGASAVSSDVENALVGYASSHVVQRWAGADRYATSAFISSQAYPRGAGTVFVASGLGFADALSGAPVAGKTPAPLLLVSSDSVPSPIGTELTRLAPKRIVILGGPSSVSNQVAKQLRGYLTP